MCSSKAFLCLNEIPHFSKWDIEARIIKHQYALRKCLFRSILCLNEFQHYPQWNIEARIIKHQYALRKYVFHVLCFYVFIFHIPVLKYFHIYNNDKLYLEKSSNNMYWWKVYFTCSLFAMFSDSIFLCWINFHIFNSDKL